MCWAAAGQVLSAGVDVFVCLAFLLVVMGPFLFLGSDLARVFRLLLPLGNG